MGTWFFFFIKINHSFFLIGKEGDQVILFCTSQGIAKEVLPIFKTPIPNTNEKLDLGVWPLI